MVTAATTTEPTNSAWPARLILVGALLGLVLTILFPTYSEIFGLWWNTSGYNHCLLIVPISVYLVWLKRDALFALAPATSLFGVAYVALNALVWFGGELLSINVFEHAGAIGVVIGTVWALIGNAAFRLLLFPMLYLYFGLPEGEFLVPYLQDLTAKVVVTLLRATDIPVFLEGRYLTIPSGHFHVAKACSGINYLIATLAVGTVFAYLRYRSTRRRLLFMTLAIFIPLAANGVRAYGIVMIAHLSNYKYAMGVDHFIYGWLFFGVVIFALFALGNLFSDADEPGETVAPARASAGSGGNPIPVVVSVVLILALLRAMTVFGVGTGDSDYDFVLPEPGPGWNLREAAESLLGTRYEGADAYLLGTYSGGDAEVAIEAYYYRKQAQGSEVINVRNDVFDDEIWRRIEGPNRRIVGHTPEFEVYELVLRRPAVEQRRIWYWFDISGRPTLSAIEAKLFSKRAVFSNTYRGEAGIIISTVIDDAGDESVARLSRFIAENRPTLERMTR